MTETLFLGFLFVIAGTVIALAAKYLPHRAALTIGLGLSLWLVYVGVFSYLGFVRNPALRPPGISFVVLPVFLFVFFVSRSDAGARIAAAVPLWILLGLQTFRIGVELLLHRLWIDGIVPRMLTFEGANVDIFIGLSAPLIAWASSQGRTGRRIALIWNILGLLALTNIVIRSLLTSPGPLHLIPSEVPNLAMGQFPYTYIAGFFAPLAITLHVLSLRALTARRGPVFYVHT